MDDISRRAFLFTGLGLLVGGCAEKKRDEFEFLTGHSTRSLDRSPAPSSQTPGTYQPPRPGAGPEILPRSQWADRAPLPWRMDPMNGIHAITVHHEGLPTPSYCTAKADVIAEMRRVSASHVRRRWGDIGYHYIIDRAGRVWEGRPLRFQGAHVKYHNYHNIGVMVMGNFEIQFPSSQQKASLGRLLCHLMARHRVPARRVYTHRELQPTACPGRYLQPHIEAFRRTVC